MMERQSGDSHVPQVDSIDKSRVLDVKPLRCLTPIFPSTLMGPSSSSTLRSGPFSSMFSSPFYPFTPHESRHSPELNQAPEVPSPLRSYRGPQANLFSLGTDCDMDTAFPNDGGSQNQEVEFNGSQKKKRKRNDKQTVGQGSGISSLMGINSLQRNDGDRDLVDFVLMTFDALRRRLHQLDEAKEAVSGSSKRMDLKSGNIMMTKGIRTNMRKRIGAVPGIEIGDIFFFRMEMCVIGLHAQTMGGIDYTMFHGASEGEPLAVSIVSSGGYEDDADDRDVLIYSGQGGNSTKNYKQTEDQKLERGNLALERSMQRANEVRVIRCMRDAPNSTTRVYIYDGLYTIQGSWTEKGRSGCNLFKYKLVRLHGQPGAFDIWKTLEKWKEGFASRTGLILPDITSGAETIPVSLVNDVDDERGPKHFTYFPNLKYTKLFSLTQPSYGCGCQSTSCLPGDLNCSCIRKNGGDFPYTSTGILVSRKPLLHECGPTCPCFPNCKNRVSQTGLKVHLEVFKTKDRGWGLRTLDPIRAGTFVCEYAGEVVDKAKVNSESDGYIFDMTRTCNAFKWNYEPGLLEEESSYGEPGEEYKIPAPLIISAKNIGNVARFMNHCCYPNVFWQPVLYEHNDGSFLHIAFFAIKHIPPMTELTYDYGIVQSENCDPEEHKVLQHWSKKCLCGSSKCRGYY